MVGQRPSLSAGLKLFQDCGRGDQQPSARVPIGAHPALTLTRGSVRLVHTAISSRMLMSG